MGHKGAVISKQGFLNEILMALCLGCEAAPVKEGAVQPAPDVDPHLQVANGVGQHTGEEDVEKDWS